MKPLVKILIVIGIIIAITFSVISFLNEFAPEAKNKEAVEKIPIVEIQVAEQGAVNLELTSEGLVKSRRQTVLTAEVSGRIVHVDPRFEVGGEFKKGDIILQLDQVNYEAALAQAKSTLADAELGLKKEAARGEQAARDWKKVGEGRTPSEMVLRIPYLESARAKVDSAQAMLKKARTDLDRTSVRAPFDCRVREAKLDLGATVMTGAQLGAVYDTAGYEVRLPFSLSNYSLVPEKASFVITNEIAGSIYQWHADLIRLEGDVDRATLSAYVIAAVQPNPDVPAAFRLPLPGMFVKAQVEGVTLDDVISVPRSAVRGREQIAVMNAEDQLEFRTLTINRSTSDQVYVTDGVKAGERIILTKLELPVVGMKLSVAKPQEDISK